MSRTEVLVKWNGDEVKRRAERLIGKSTWTIGMAVLSDAKSLCAVNYGYLAASLMAASNDGQATQLDNPASFAKEQQPVGHNVSSFKPIASPGTGELAGQVFVGTAVDYAPYVEYGTRHSWAQPYLRPALDAARGKAWRVVYDEAHDADTLAEYLQ